MSELERRLADYRRRVLQRDQQAALTLIAAFGQALDRIRPAAELLQWEIDELGKTNVTRILSLDRYVMLERQIVDEMNALAWQTGTSVRGAEAEMIQLGAEAALRLVEASASDPTIVAGFTRVNPDAVRELVGATEPDSPVGRLLDSFGEDAAKLLRETLITAVATGTNPRPVAAALQAATGMSATRALAISRTEILRAYRTSQLAHYAANDDILKGWKWLSAKQRRTCAACLAMDGTVFPLSQTFFPAHVNCFVAGTLVSGPDAVAGMSRWYSGSAVQVETERGRRLTVTPNHPVLTPEGWIAAGLLNEGGYLIGRAIGERSLAGIDGNDDDVPTRIEEVVESLRRTDGMRSVSVPATAEYFHGDGLGSEVEIVGSDRLLGDALNPAISQISTQRGFVRRRVRDAHLSSERALASFLYGAGSSTDCVVCGERVSLSFVGAGVRHTDEHAFAATARTDSRIEQITTDRGSLNAVRGGERLFGLTGDVSGDDIFSGQRSQPNIADSNAGRLQHIGDVSGAGLIDAGDLLNRLSGEVAPDRIVRIDHVWLTGHVYNLQTTEHWYYANGIISHNCRCSARPVLKDEYAAKRDPVERGADWLARQSAETQDAILGKQGGAAYRAGEVQLGDFVRTDKHPTWGESKRDGGIAWARMKAEARRRLNALPPATAEPIAYRKFESKQDAESYFSSIGVDVKTGKASLTTLNLWGQGYDNLRRLGIDLPKGLDFEEHSQNLVAQHAPFSRRILVNTAAPYWKSATKNARLQRASGWWSTDDPLGVIYHEVGHYLHWRTPTGLDRRGSVSTDLLGTIRSQVSRYGATEESEFVAEVFAGKVAGRTFPEEIERYYRELDGPEIPSKDERAA